MLGKVLNGRYLITEALGSGGFSETYLALDKFPDVEQKCVIKILKPDINNSLLTKIFKKEVQTLSELGIHNQIPQLLDSFQEEQNYYIVQEFIQGHKLREEITVGKPWKENIVVEFLKDILEILDFVHQKNVIHGDIKPENIMRREKDKKLMLIDFGGVKRFKIDATSTTISAVIGTPEYMPFEQRENKICFSSDIYAVGIVAIEALTGCRVTELPVEPINLQIIWRHKASVNVLLADILDKMIRFGFSERYQSASEVLYALKTLSFTSQDWYNQGKKLFEMQHHHEAVKAYNEALKIQPHYFAAWKFQGYAFSKLEQHDNALESFNQAIKLKADDFDAWYYHGCTLANLERYKEALSSYNQALKIKPESYQAEYNKGLVLYELEKYDEASSSFISTIKLKPNHYEALYNCGLAEYQQQLYESASNFFQQATQIKLDDADAWYNYGLTLYHLRKYSKAFKSFKKVLRIRTDDLDAYYQCGKTAQELKKYKRALSYLEKVVKMNPNHYQAWYNRGLVCEKLGDYRSAIESLKKSIHIKHDFDEAKINLSRIREKDNPLQKGLVVGLIVLPIVIMHYYTINNNIIIALWNGFIFSVFYCINIVFILLIDEPSEYFTLIFNGTYYDSFTKLSQKLLFNARFSWKAMIFLYFLHYISWFGRTYAQIFQK